MRINMICIGQQVQILAGRYRGKTGVVTKLYRMADHTQAGNFIAVRMSGKGIRNYTQDWVKVAR